MVIKMKSSIKHNYIYNTISQLLLIIVPLITTPYVSRVLGVENVGYYSFANSIVIYFVVFATFGSTVFGQRNIAFYRDNKDKINDWFWNVFFFRIISSIISFVIYIVFLIVSNNFNELFLLVSLNIFNVVVDITWFFQGLENFKQIVFRNIIIKLLSTLSIFLVVKTSSDLLIYVLIVCGSTFIGNVSLWGILIKYINKPKKISPFNGFKDMLLIFLPTIAIQIYAVLDKSMIGFITNSYYANGCYEQAEKIARLALTVVTSVGTVILPKVANLYHKKNIEEAKKFVYLSYRFTWFLALPILFGLMSISSTFIPIFLGNGYEDAIILLQIFSFLVLFVSLAHTTGNAYLIPTKQQNVYTIAASVSAVLNLILNLILIPKYSAKGAAIASIIAEFVGCFIQLLYCFKTKQLELKKVFKGMWKYLISSIIMFVIIASLKLYLDVTIFSLLLEICTGVIVYGIVLLILKDEYCIDVLNRFMKFFKTK